MWDDKGYTDTLFFATVRKNSLGSFNDKASSLYNHSSSSWVIQENTNGGSLDAGRLFCIMPGFSVADLGAAALKFNDKVSAIDPVANCRGYSTIAS